MGGRGGGKTWAFRPSLPAVLGPEPARPKRPGLCDPWWLWPRPPGIRSVSLQRGTVARAGVNPAQGQQCRPRGPAQGLAQLGACLGLERRVTACPRGQGSNTAGLCHPPHVRSSQTVTLPPQPATHTPITWQTAGLSSGSPGSWAARARGSGSCRHRRGPCYRRACIWARRGRRRPVRTQVGTALDSSASQPARKRSTALHGTGAALLGKGQGLPCAKQKTNTPAWRGSVDCVLA